MCNRDFAERSKPKTIFFCTKTASFSPRAEQTDANQACHRRGIITKYLMTVYGGLRAEPQAAGPFSQIFCKKIAILKPF